MADCVSNAAEQVSALRLSADGSFVSIINRGVALQSADAIEQLMQENAKLKAERDAAVKIVLRLQSTCEQYVSDMGCDPLLISAES